MNTYYIPRNTKGEGRILYIFSTKALIYTAVAGGLGFIIYLIIKSMFGAGKIGLIILAILALLGYAIGTFKIPDSPRFDVTRKAGGQNIDEIIIRYFKFKNKKNKIYIYDGEVTEDE